MGNAARPLRRQTDTMIAQFSALKEMGWDTALSELAETVSAYASLAATLAEPYLDTFGEFIASLNINVTDDVAAEPAISPPSIMS